MSENHKIEIAVFQKAKTGKSCCGDSYFYTETEDGFVCALADGLGSGQYAKESSAIVIDTIKESADATVEQLVEIANTKLIGKRGAVLGIFKVDFHTMICSFSTIGNIGAVIATKDKKKRIVPNIGYLGSSQRTFKVIQEEIEPGTNFIMFSDGVKDLELSNVYFSHEDIRDIIKSYEHISEEERQDDTTLIAMRFVK
ncbi:protein phosphatase 2C domain-containing protein [Oceanobacillus bengalensis]|uniref:Indirect negative regulator of sigma-B activity n=1 Tax=Oceanobacillus bengalensis TaxID=1435466 RepID=A0A494YRU9_9BACI|nr:protein phosphatase 2C domain-containing protein [Oceanobacillus bengalensis]RKQ12357.1 indirect negative regulator of sigma-B activity [Oceanobacillus bengalensis]